MSSDLVKAVEIFMPPGSIKELRLLTDEGIMSGYFNDRRSLVMTAETMSECDEVKAVYWGLNEIDPKTLKFITNNVAKRTYATRATNIAARKWMLVDIDPERPKGTNATETEKAAAWDVTVAVQTFLRSLGWPEPVVIDSGNGYHSIYPISLPAADSTTVKETLRILSWKFSSAGAVVDTSVHDSCRITKVPGTMSRKGPHSEDRPWRQSKLLVAPSISRRLTYADLIGLRKHAPPPEPKKMVVTPAVSQKNMKEFFAHYEPLIYMTGFMPKPDGTTHYYLDVCPFNDFSHHSNHGDRKTAIIVGADSIGFKCFADQCDGEFSFDDLLTLLAEELGEPRFDIHGIEAANERFGVEWVI
ncbi:MAG: hypothetical protein M3O31_06045 [Acidobacteriota bacterium]|nr:hypothetical protein [Acidobacteriota bacterium]